MGRLAGTISGDGLPARLHHDDDSIRGFGVTSPPWDRAFGTLPRR